MEGTKQSCNIITRDIWEWCIKKNIWLIACHLPGVEKTVADHESRLNHDNTEWQLNPKLFSKWDRFGLSLKLICLNLESISVFFPV